MATTCVFQTLFVQQVLTSQSTSAKHASWDSLPYSWVWVALRVGGPEVPPHVFEI